VVDRDVHTGGRTIGDRGVNTTRPTTWSILLHGCSNRNIGFLLGMRHSHTDSSLTGGTDSCTHRHPPSLCRMCLALVPIGTFKSQVFHLVAGLSSGK
jgi:hypothetical protein